MIGSTMLKQRLAGFIWAAILMVAVQFVPNLAFAHSGHSHQKSEVTMAVSSAPEDSSKIAVAQTPVHAAMGQVIAERDNTDDVPAGSCISDDRTPLSSPSSD